MQLVGSQCFGLVAKSPECFMLARRTVQVQTLSQTKAWHLSREGYMAGLIIHQHLNRASLVLSNFSFTKKKKVGERERIQSVDQITCRKVDMPIGVM